MDPQEQEGRGRRTQIELLPHFYSTPSGQLCPIGTGLLQLLVQFQLQSFLLWPWTPWTS